MSKSILTLAILLLTSLAWAQDKPAQVEPDQKPPTTRQVISNHNAYKYQVALRYNDYSVAKNALYSLLIENPQNDSILFSLSALYFQMQQYASAALAANDLVARNPDHLGALEISANSLDNLGAKDKALANYETLYLKTDDLQVLYKVAFLQFEMGRYGESITNADILLSKKKLDELTAVFNTRDGQQKEYPIKVALLNLKGMVNQAQDKNEKAKEFYQQALDIAPDFALAKENMASLSK